MQTLNIYHRGTIQRFGRLLARASFLTFVLISLGSLVRATGSGLACPDWPLCFGQVVPRFDVQIFLEWFHRVVAGTLSLIVMYGVFLAIWHRIVRQLFWRLLMTLVALLCMQIILGGLTVLHLLDPIIVSLHLVTGVTFFATMIWGATQATFATSPEGFGFNLRAPPWFRHTLLALSGLVLLQIGVGGLVSSNHAGLACPDFPTCNGEWLPPYHFLNWLQMSHRYLALAVLIGIGLVNFLANSIRLSNGVRRMIRLATMCTAVQVGLGLVNIWFNLPIWASVLHLANAALIFALIWKVTIVVKMCSNLAEMEQLATSMLPKQLFTLEPKRIPGAVAIDQFTSHTTPSNP